MMKTTRSLGPAWLSLLLLLLMGSATAMMQKATRETWTKAGASSVGQTKYLTPGCKNNGKNMKAHVRMCASDSIQMKIDGQLAFLVDDQPWADLPGPNPDLLFYTPATTMIDGPLFAENITVNGYFKVGNITLGPDSDMSALQGPQGPQGPAG